MRIIRLAAVLLVLFLATQGSELRASPRPNIVFILADDLGWSDLGCYGHQWHRTPNIDRLAQQGMRFTNGYSPAPICSAARASILTGKAVPRLQFEFVTKNDPGHQKIDAEVALQTPPFTLNLPTKELTIAEHLAKLNYRTAFFGKWHVSQHYKRRYLAWHPEFGPKKQGFQFAEEDFGDHPYAWGKRKPADLSEGKFPEDSMIERATKFVRTNHDRPYFLMVSMFHVHTPVKNRCRWLVDQYDTKIPRDIPNREKRLEYAAFVETLDHHVGTILEAINQADIQKETLIVFTSDNGGHPEYCGNAPLRGSKWNLYEGGIRVPFIASWSGKIQPESTCKTPVIGYDLLPTFVELAGGQADNIDGVSIARTFEKPQTTFDRSLIWHFPYYHPERTYSKAIEKIGVNDFAVSKTKPQSALRRGNIKIIHFAEDDRVELYDLSKDISEQNDLSKTKPELAQNLKSLLDQKLTDMHARRAVPK